jgi:tetratricopeptide (TPR) repeat protein
MVKSHLQSVLFRGCIFALLVSALLAQCHPDSNQAAKVSSSVMLVPIGIKSGIGRIHEPVTTASPLAQIYYDQGVTLLYAYDWIDAARSFSTALRYDPTLAMAYLGLSYAYSGLGEDTAAAAAENRARSFAQSGTAQEKTRIDLRKIQLEAMASDDRGVTDGRYVMALDKSLSEDSFNIPLLLLRGNAAEGTPWGRGQRGGTLSSHYYKEVLKLDSLNPVAHHFLIHSCEISGDFTGALKHARAFLDRAPSLSHAHHMFGHELLRVGRTNEAIDQFEKADRLTKYDFAGTTNLLVHDWHYRHNLKLLSSAYRLAGKTKQAEAVLIKLAALPVFSAGDEIYQAQLMEFVLEQGRYSIIIGSPAKYLSAKTNIGRALQHAFKGSALASSGNNGAAGEELLVAQDYLKRVNPDWRPPVQSWLELLQAQVEIGQSKHALATSRLIRTAQDTVREYGTDAWSDALFQLKYIAEVASRAGLQEATYFATEQLNRLAPDWRAVTPQEAKGVAFRATGRHFGR